jgi:hypothetical protein
MKVGQRRDQFRKMLEAVQNHSPQALIIDEIGTHEEVNEAVAIQQRGVQLIATTHGRTLADIICNPHLRNLLGGSNVVILSAFERKEENSKSKTRLERKTLPAFDVCVELLGTKKWRVHHNVAAAVDAVLRDLGETVECEIRELNNGTLVTRNERYPDPESMNIFKSNLFGESI